MTAEHESQEISPSTTLEPFPFREYLGVLIPTQRELTEEEQAELVANPDKPLTFAEYLGAILPKR